MSSRTNAHIPSVYDNKYKYDNPPTGGLLYKNTSSTFSSIQPQESGALVGGGI